MDGKEEEDPAPTDIAQEIRRGPLGMTPNTGKT
jgi:hypothetical protein